MNRTLRQKIRASIPSPAFNALLDLKQWLRPPSYRRTIFSQEGEDAILARYFAGEALGTYVDVGAHHPRKFSNTHYFYRQGWRGLNVEPNPDMHAEFLKQRPEDINLQLGISGQEGSLTFFMFQSAVYNTCDEALAKQRAGTVSKLTRQITIPVRRLENILAEQGDRFRNFSFLSVDVEGLDFAVLQSNDWARFRPRMVLFEVYAKDVESLLQTAEHEFMKRQGYRFVAKAFNTVFYGDREWLDRLHSQVH